MIIVRKPRILSADSNVIFHFLKGINREVNPSHVSKIAEAVKTIGIITREVVVARISFIDGIARNYIIDGQHLYKVCKLYKLPIKYELIVINNLEELISKIALYNASSKNWCLQDYINIWSVYKDDYKEFINLFEKYNVERTILAELLHTGIVAAARNGGNATIAKAIKEGKFRIINKKQAIEVLDYVVDLRYIFKDLGRVAQRGIISAMIEKIKAEGVNYNHNKFKKHLETKISELKLASQDINEFRNLLTY